MQLPARHVVILATPNAQSLEVAGPVEVFAMAEQKLREAGRTKMCGYRVTVASAAKNLTLTSPSGLSFLAHCKFDEVRQCDGSWAMAKYIRDHGYALSALVAFTGEVFDKESGPDPFTETSTVLNPNLRNRDMREAFATDEYQILLVANKFQTGFDQPLPPLFARKSRTNFHPNFVRDFSAA